MSSNLYNIYLNQTLQLAKTLVIKSEDSAYALNAGLIEYGYTVDESRPSTWMYYLNLAGDYHSLNTMMTVLSLDTLEIIDFTKENLLEHRTTAREYTYGSDYYRELVRRYPDQKALIRGIINPVDLQEAIAADDFTVLYYDKDLIEEGEENVIPNLQLWVNAYRRRWYNSDFLKTEDLYTAAALAMMHFSIPQAIMNIRTANCHTEFVHSFHLWSYLASHNYLDDYKEFLTRKQALWLYRNIPVIERNVGKKMTMTYLIEHIMTDRGFPIGEYGMLQITENQPDVIYPDAGLSFTPLNFEQAQEIQHDDKTIREILEKENPLARDNPVNIDDAERRITYDMTRGLLGAVPTKVLESEITDMSLFTPVRLIDVLYNHWVLFSTEGVYTTMVTIQNPYNGESMTMSAKDAFVAFIYCLNRAFGVHLVNVPDVEAWDVVQLTRPTFKELRGLAEPYFVSDYLIRTAMDQVPSIRRIVSTEGFYLKCVELREGMLAHRELYSLRERHQSRGQMEGICRHMYQTKRCKFVDKPTTFEDFFKTHNWDLMDLPESTYSTLAREIITIATGQDLFYAKSLQEIQAAMLRLMLQLSSYSIHAIQTINTIPAIVTDWRVIRVGNIYSNNHFHVRHPWMPAHVKDWDFAAHSVLDYQLTTVGSDFSAWIKSKGYLYWDIDLDMKQTGRFSMFVRGVQPSVWVRRAAPKPLPDLILKTDLDGLIDWNESNPGGKVIENDQLNGLYDWVQENKPEGY